MITTDFVPGSPCWLDLGAPDVEDAAAFYRAVFGWELQPMGGDVEGPGGMLQQDGKTVAGLGPLTEEGARSAWMIYFSTPDAEAAAQTVERLGGTVRVPPLDADGEGRMAQFTDPQGGQFAVWQPGATKGVEAVDEPGTLMWTELYTTDIAAAKEFYGALFDWTTQEMPLPGGEGSYWLIAPFGLGQERMQGGMMEVGSDMLGQTGGRPYWHPVFHVADCDEAASKITANGGSVPMGPETAEGVGRMALGLDPAGADFVVLTPSPGES